MMLMVELVDDELDIEPIHRLLDLPGRRRHSCPPRRRVRDRRARRLLDRSDRAPPAPHGRRARARHRRRRRPRDRNPERRRSARAALADEDPAVASTDAAVVEALVAPRLPEATWRYWHDASGVAAQVDKGTATAAILCSPVSVAQTRAAAIEPRAHAAKDHVLHTEAPVGDGVPKALAETRLVDRPRRGGAEQACESSPGPLRSAAATS